MTHDTQEQCDAEHRFDDEREGDSQEVANLRANMGRFEAISKMIDNNDDVDAFEPAVNRLRIANGDVVELYEKLIARLERLGK